MWIWTISKSAYFPHKFIDVSLWKLSTNQFSKWNISILKNQLQEAELCIQDCYECASTSTTGRSETLQKEIDAADSSIDMAVAHFVDLLDAKQHQSSSSSSSTSSSPSTMNHQDGNDDYNNMLKAIPTEDLVKRIKHLRAEITKLKLVQQQSIVTDHKATDWTYEKNVTEHYAIYYFSPKARTAVLPVPLTMTITYTKHSHIFNVNHK